MTSTKSLLIASALVFVTFGAQAQIDISVEHLKQAFTEAKIPADKVEQFAQLANAIATSQIQHCEQLKITYPQSLGNADCTQIPGSLNFADHFEGIWNSVNSKKAAQQFLTTAGSTDMQALINKNREELIAENPPADVNALVTKLGLETVTAAISDLIYKKFPDLNPAQAAHPGDKGLPQLQ